MCLLCDDEKSYAAYMAYLDAMERQQKEGRKADPDAAVDAALAVLDAAPHRPAPDMTLSVHTPDLAPPPSPFSCSPVDDD